jgi:5-hydroxyisourate hydrolase
MITTHVLDLARGQPAAGIAVTLSTLAGDAWIVVGSGVTDARGRLAGLTTERAVPAGRYRLTFETAGYFAAQGTAAYYPDVQVTFVVPAGDEDHHVPLLLGPFGYTTYRGG